MERFWNKVAIGSPDECWPWRAGIGGSGYGVFWHNGKSNNAHRFAYELKVGPIPKDFCVCHKCDNRVCVNPSHLWLGSVADNNQDRKEKGRSAIGDRNGQRTHPERTARGELAGNAKLTAKKVILIRARFAAGVSLRQLARDYGVTHIAIHHIVCRRNWRHIK